MNIKLFLWIILIIGVFGLAFGIVMNFMFGLFTLPIACVVSVSVGLITSAIINLLFHRDL